MLDKNDLTCFVELVQRAQQAPLPETPASLESLIHHSEDSNQYFHLNELSRLASLLKIANVAGDIPACPYRILEAIVQNLVDKEAQFLPFKRTSEWLGAIHWAIPHLKLADFEDSPDESHPRESVVGNACRTLRSRGFPVEISAAGIHITNDTMLKIAKEVDFHIRSMGGLDAISQICLTVKSHKGVYDGMWLFGNVPRRKNVRPIPAIPIGWLFSIALRNIHTQPSTMDATSAWKRAVDLATAFAASTNCQRYNPYDGFLSLAAPDFVYTLMDALVCRELFTLPQVPSSVLPTIRDACSNSDWPSVTEALQSSIVKMFNELISLVKCANECEVTTTTQSTANRMCPELWKIARASRGVVNQEYLDPFSSHPRDHDQHVFFDMADREVMILPKSMTAANGCEAIFRHIWKSLHRDTAGEIVGSIIEKCVVLACQRHEAAAYANLEYEVDGQEFEIDVAVRDGRKIVLFESKAKSLTSKSRIGKINAVIDDYTNSFLAMLPQLINHEKNINRGLTPLVRRDEDTNSLQVKKVAVSPLSYGPTSDSILITSLIHALSNARFSLTKVDKELQESIEGLNNAISLIERTSQQFASSWEGEGSFELARYMMDVSWLDLGELIYSIQRGYSVFNGVTVRDFLTYSTRDFWTEVALADRDGLVKRYWYPLQGRSETE